jgi:hypothetical protein
MSKIMDNESKQVTYTFWFSVMRKSVFAYSFPWDIPKQLAKVIVSDDNISSDGPIWVNSLDTLNIPLSTIAKTKLVISTGQIGALEIITQESKHYLFVPVNPFDPTLLSHSNVDEVMAFISVVDAFKDNRNPDLDENPYIRQFQKKDKPDYLANKMDFLWDKNVSPWEYYYSFVPASTDKKKRVMARFYKVIVLGALIIIILLALYAIYTQFKW